VGRAETWPLPMWPVHFRDVMVSVPGIKVQGLYERIIIYLQFVREVSDRFSLVICAKNINFFNE